MPISRLHVLLGVLLAAAALWVYVAIASKEAPSQPVEMPLVVESPVARSEQRSERAEVVREAASEPAPAESTATAMLIVDGVRYPLTAPAGATLKEAMDRLDAESEFSYRYRNYAGLGAFVTHINDRASTGDLVWILYVDDEKSSAGISSTRIRSGTVIEWKLEESY